MYKFIFKLSIILALLAACSDIERDNLLDPKNPDSYSDTPILIEAFVNTSFEYDAAALVALDQIQAQLGDNTDIEIVEYHRPHEQAVNDQFPYEKAKFKTLQKKYAEYYPDTICVPDIYVNGSEGRVFGSTTEPASVYERLAPIISNITGRQSEYSLEVDLQTSGENLNIDYRIARLGNESAEDLIINIILVKDDSPTNSNRIAVNQISPAAQISKIKAGEYFEGKIEPVDCPEHPDYALFTITRQNDITVLKTLKKEIPW